MRRALPLLLLLSACSAGHHAPPTSERVVYHVVDFSGAVSTSTVDVSPPYRARTIDERATGRSGFVWDDTALYTISATGTAETAYIPPTFPGPFSALSISLPEAAAQHLVSQGGSSTVLGRPCTQWVSAEPLDGGPFAPASSSEHTTSCVDATGLLLSDSWYSLGKLVRARTATFVGRGPSIAGPSLYDGKPTPLPTAAAQTLVHPVALTKLAGLLQFPLPRGPAGYKQDRSVGVVQRDPTGGISGEGAVITWVRGSGQGTKLVVLSIDRTLTPGDRATVHGVPVDLGPLGTGHLEPVLAGLEVVVDDPSGVRLTVTANLPRSQLLPWMRTLHLRPGP